MRNRLNKLLAWLGAFGFEPVRTRAAIKNLPVTLKEFRWLKGQNSALEDKWPINFSKPSFHDRDDPSGVATGHYFHQDLLVARRIFERRPKKHVDVGSRVDGFVAHVAVFREIEVFDVRPISSQVRNIHFRKADLMNPENDLVDYCDSLSCLHALEHFGLGRYSDPMDIQGDKKGFKALERMLKPNGILYLSVPIGEERIEFNGHRIFSIRRVQQLYASRFNLTGFSYVDDNGDLIENVDDITDGLEGNFGLNYGCGIFELQKKSE